MTDAPQTPQSQAAPDFAGEDFDPATGARDMDVSADAGDAPARDVIDLSGPGAAPAPAREAPPAQPLPNNLTESELSDITTRIVEQLKTVYDPEIPVDIYELGLIYKVDYDPAREGAGGKVRVEMTLTAPGCPVAGEMPVWVEDAVRAVDGVDDVSVDMVFDPPWTPERMSDEARLELGWM